MTESKEIYSDLIPKIATGFCGGISRTNNMCGAVTGAIMVLNIFFGRNDLLETRDATYEIVNKLITNFLNKFNTTNCKELTGCDLGTDEGHAKYEDQNLEVQCKEYVEEMTKKVMSLIEIHDK